VAGNPNTPATVLTTLATDKASWVRREVAGNPATPAAVLTALATDEDYKVRMDVGRNRNTPATVLTTLARDRTASVRQAVADHPMVPSAVAADLNAAGFVNPDAPVDEQLTQSVEFIAKVRVAKQRAEFVRKLVDPAALEAFAGDQSLSVRQAAVENPACPDSALQTALRACDGNTHTGIAVNLIEAAIRHPNASDETLCLAARLANGRVLTLLLNREPPVSFEVLLAGIEKWACPVDVAKRTLQRRSQELNSAQWEALWKDGSVKVRQVTASCRATPPEILERLAMDEHRDVREAVRKNRKASDAARATAALLN
jgi:hypothetical protein